MSILTTKTRRHEGMTKRGKAFLTGGARVDLGCGDSAGSAFGARALPEVFGRMPDTARKMRALPN